ncbi:DgyrCDS2088 [Dimorphilus gyrociliatus]|uniref:DgyrCDS2088 n=1 Tax=Dimorphilus gyrociliatus TaxID=2664684 RepID=A0A7I8V9E8_9ANNE|nr:DgyrCDS2088 [Dimorphilus gyrociliatus]
MIENSERIVEHVKDTVMDVCRLSLASENKYTVDGLIGVTLSANKEVILIKINEAVVNSTGIDHNDDSPATSIPEFGDENGPITMKNDECKSAIEDFVSGPQMHKVERARIKRLIFDTVMMLCKSSLKDIDFQVDGLIGITLAGSEVFLIKFDQHVKSRLDICSIARASGILPEENNNDTTNLAGEMVEEDKKPDLQTLESIPFHPPSNIPVPIMGVPQDLGHSVEMTQLQSSGPMGYQPVIQHTTMMMQHNQNMHQIQYPGGPPTHWNAQPDKTYTELKSPKEEAMMSQQITMSPIRTPDKDMNRKKRSFQCDRCTKMFTCRALLDNHIRTHTGEKPFTCDICHKSFKEKSHLRRHKWTHDDTRPHNCSHCNKGFITKGEFRNHMKRYHEVEIP